jgi:uncharacterized protein YfaQ (DUF2300 family)
MRRALLLSAFGLLPGVLSALGSDCRRLPEAEAWLQGQAQRWERQLAALDGYERPDPPRVCLAAAGSPAARYDRDLILLRRAGGTGGAAEDQLSLAHEYLHLAFKHHPAAWDEAFIEALARQLVLGIESP